jgi:hypothetical protein
MSSLCGAPIKARVARLVALDTCGTPITGASSAVVVTKGFIKVEMTSNYEDGQEFLVKNANGEPCVNQKDDSFLKRVGLSIDFCSVDPDSIVIITGERLLTTGSTTGAGVAFSENLLTARWSLEVWTPVAGSSACDASGNQQFVYWAWANAGNSKVGNITFENNSVTFNVTGETRAAGSHWDRGPGTGTKWLPASQGFETDEHWAFFFTTTAPPTPPSVCGAVALT